MLDLQFTAVNLVLDQEILVVDVLCLLRRGHSAIGSKNDGGLVVFVQDVASHVIPSGLDKTQQLHGGRYGIIHAYQFALGRAACVEFLLLGKAHC